MRKSNLRIIIIAIISLLTMNFQCKKDELVYSPAHQYNEKIRLSPNKKIYNVGDTIWLEFQTINKSLFDAVTNNTISNDTTSLSLTFQYEKRYPIQFTGTDTFCYTKTLNGVNQGLQVSQDHRQYNYLYYSTNCSNQNYSFKVALIPKRLGIYSINQPGGNVTDCPNKIIKSISSPVNFVFDVADCNKDIYLSIPPASRGESVKGYSENKIDKKEVYVFKVD